LFAIQSSTAHNAKYTDLLTSLATLTITQHQEHKANTAAADMHYFCVYAYIYIYKAMPFVNVQYSYIIIGLCALLPLSILPLRLPSDDDASVSSSLPGRVTGDEVTIAGCILSRYVSGQTNNHTDRRTSRHTNCNTLHPHWGQSNI